MSTYGSFTTCRKFRDPDVPTCLLKSAPDTCSVFVVSKGRIHTAGSAARHPPPSKTITPKRRSRNIPVSNHAHDAPDTDEINRYIICPHS